MLASAFAMPVSARDAANPKDISAVLASLSERNHTEESAVEQEAQDQGQDEPALTKASERVRRRKTEQKSGGTDNSVTEEVKEKSASTASGTEDGTADAKVAAGIEGGTAAVEGDAGTESITAAAESASGRMEGPGFETPEKAASAYMEAFAANDLSGLIASCAVESYVDHYDLSKQVDRVKVATYAMFANGLPGTSDFTRDLNLELRRSAIVQNLKNQFLFLAGSEAVDEIVQYHPEENTLEEFMDRIYSREDSERLSSISFAGIFISPDILTGGLYGRADNIERFKVNMSAYNAEDVASLAALFTADRQPYIMTFTLGKYNGKWFVLGTEGYLQTLMGIPFNSGGLTRADMY